MNKTRLIIFLAGFLVTLILPSCELDDFNSGTNDDRDKITDTWKCEENSSISGSRPPYSSEITKSNVDSFTVFIYNFYQLGNNESVYATLENRIIDIPEQSIDQHIVSGSGRVASDYESIVFTYKVDEGSGIIDDVEATYSRY
jgi:hypothetical protein